MVDEVYLVCDKSGVRKLAKRPPSLEAGEIAVKLKVTVPPSVFATYIPTVAIDIDERCVRREQVSVQQYIASEGGNGKR